MEITLTDHVKNEKNITKSQVGEEYPTQNKKKED